MRSTVLSHLSEKEFYKILRTTRFRLFKAPTSKKAAYETIVSNIQSESDMTVDGLVIDLKRTRRAAKYLHAQRQERLKYLSALLEEHLDNEHSDDLIFIHTLELKLNEMREADETEV
jgi:hypothetical protein